MQIVLLTNLTTRIFGRETGGCDGSAMVIKHHGSLFDVRAGTLRPRIREGPSQAQLRKAGTYILNLRHIRNVT